MTKIGYARVSSKEQNLSRQLDSLKQADVKKIFEEKISGKDRLRPELTNMLNFIRENDEVIVSSLDRLGRNSSDIKDIMQEIKAKGATLTILNLPSFQGVENENLRDLLNSLMIDLFSYVAENERETIRERQKEGIKIAKEKGIYKGRTQKFTKDSKEVKNAIDMFNNRDKNSMTIDQIAKANGMSRRTFYRRLKELNIM